MCALRMLLPNLAIILQHLSANITSVCKDDTREKEEDLSEHIN